MVILIVYLTLKGFVTLLHSFIYFTECILYFSLMIVLCILDHNLVYCTRKTPSLKLSKHNDLGLYTLKQCR